MITLHEAKNPDGHGCWRLLVSSDILVSSKCSGPALSVLPEADNNLLPLSFSSRLWYCN
jgi:hypothetical protein